MTDYIINKHNVFSMSIVFFMLILIFFSGCNPSFENESDLKSYQIEVTDFRGKVLKFEEPVTRVVCLIESALTGLYMLNAGESVVGVSSNIYNTDVYEYYAMLDERIANKQIYAPGNWDFVNVEGVLSLQPDLVIMWASQTESIRALESRGIKVYAVMLHSFADVKKEITDFAELTGTQDRAKVLLEYINNELREIEILRQAISEKKSVYFMWAQGILSTSGVNSTVNELIELAGCINACDLPDEHITINREKLIEWNPNIILMWYNDKLNVDDVIEMPSIKQLDAIRNKNVFEFPSVFFCDLWTLKYIYAVKFLMSAAYPHISDQICVKNEERKIMENLYGYKNEGK